MTAKVLIVVGLVVIVLVFRLLIRGQGRKLLALAVAGLIAFPFAWHFIGVHHLFAPPDPYGPCPPPTQYHSGWMPLDGFSQWNGGGNGQPPIGQSGVVVYHGWVELAGCGMSIKLGAGT